MWVEIVKLLETPPPTLYHYTQMCLTVERLYRCDCSFLRQKFEKHLETETYNFKMSFRSSLIFVWEVLNLRAYNLLL